MKKFIAVLAATTVASLGAVTLSPAHAADYTPGATPTSTQANVPASTPKRTPFGIKVAVDAQGSNATPKGAVRLKIVKIKTGRVFLKTVTPLNSNAVAKFNVKGLPRGKYTVKTVFFPNNPSRFNKSRNFDELHVTA